MVYPQTGLPAVIEIAPGAVLSNDPGTWPWVDVTYAWRIRDGITITEGRGDWGQHVDAGSIGLTFDERSGDFSEYNPLGQWFGLLGRDTPLRVRIRRGADAFGRTTSSGLGISDSGQVWTTSGGSATDYSTIPGAARHSHPTINVLRRTLLNVNLVDVEQLIDASTSVLLTGAALVTGTLARYQDANNYYWLRAEFNAGGTAVQLKITKTVAGVETQLANLNPLPGLAYAANTPLRVRTSVVDNRLAIKVWLASGPEPSAWSLTATDSSITQPGQTGIQSWVVSGNTNTPPVVASFANYQLLVDLAGGLVPAWVPRWDQSGKDRTVPVTARGALYRLQPGSGTPPTRSALRRTIVASGPGAYWPSEDGEVSTQVGSAVPTVPALTLTGTVKFVPLDQLNFGGSSLYGTKALLDLSSGGTLSGSVPTSVTAATGAAQTVHLLARVTVPGISRDMVIEEWDTPGGSFVRWQLVLTTTSHTQLIAYTAAGAATTVVDVPSVTTSFVQWDVSLWQSGGTINVGLFWDGSSAYTYTGSTAGLLAGITAIRVNPTGATLAGDQIPVGHIAIWGQQPYPYRDGGPDIYGVSPVYGPTLGGYINEAATVRLPRLAAEDDTPVAVPAVAADAVVRMGFQAPGTPLDLYRQCEATDGGVLFERPFRLSYQPRVVRYNQAPALILSASGDLSQAPQPDPDSQGYRNRQTVNRIGGSSAVAEADEVAAGAVVYDESTDLSLAVDTVLANHAGWRLHLSGQQGLRWPRLDLDLAARPALIDAWLNCRVGSRIQATNPPVDVAGQDIDLLLEGHTTTLGYKDWQIAANCSPAGPWDVATVDGGQRVAADGSTLGTGGLTLAGTSFLLTSTASNGPWTTDPANFPLDVRVGGERVTLSGISGTSSPQTATVSARGVNGITRAWPAGTEVDVWVPAIVAL